MLMTLMRLTMNTFLKTTLIFFHWLRSSPSDITAPTCNIGLASSCEIFVAKMIPEEEFDSARITSVVNGRNSRANSPNVDDAAGPNIAVRNARKVPGLSTVIGVSLHHNDYSHWGRKVGRATSIGLNRNECFQTI